MNLLNDDIFLESIQAIVPYDDYFPPLTLYPVLGEVGSPTRLNPKYFNSKGLPTKSLTQAYLAVEESLKTDFSSIEVFELYVVGSNAVGNFHERSDLDLYIHAKVGYHEGKTIANDLSERINKLSDYYPTLQKEGINPNEVDKELLNTKGLLEAGEEPSLIKIMSHLGIIKKEDLVDTIVGGGLPWGTCYALRDAKWVKFKEGNKQHQGPISEFFVYGF